MSAPDHSELPLRDYDHLPLPALGHRIRSLTADEVAQVLAYERTHAHRPAAVQIFENRLAELAAGATPGRGRRQSGPEWPEQSSRGSAVRPETMGPSASPPPHGNPAQPARPKGNRRGS